jgi:hypothetical protein
MRAKVSGHSGLSCDQNEETAIFIYKIYEYLEV